MYTTHGVCKKVSDPMGLEFEMGASYSGRWEWSPSPGRAASAL